MCSISASRAFLSYLTSSTASSTFSETEDEYSSFSDLLFPDCDYLHFIDKLSETKHPVYLVSCSRTNCLYAIKLFYWEHDEPSPCYTQELQFTKIAHSNVINIVDHKEEQDLFDNILDPIKASYILMDYMKHGDFLSALITRKILLNEVLARTYFRQLIEGIEALHSKGAAHLDLKLENLLIGDDYTLKLTDFDLSYVPGDSRIKSRGTKNYRAPEIMENKCTDPYAADIYSAGVILFLLKTGGKMAFTETEYLSGWSMAALKEIDPKLFWEKKSYVLGETESFFSEEFKELFTRMTKPKPKDRPTIAEIKKSSWYSIETYSQKQIEEFMSSQFRF